MNRGHVGIVLSVYFGVVLTGVAVQIDRYPLSWVPMYARPRTPPEVRYRVLVRDKKAAAKGFLVTHVDGSTSCVGTDELNIPSRNMWRLYYERAFGKSPPKFRQGNESVDAFSRWARGLGADERVFEANWPKRLFISLNKTLGHRPGDPQFIVAIEVSRTRRSFAVEDLALLKSRTKVSRLEWNPEWAGAWQ